MAALVAAQELVPVLEWDSAVVGVVVVAAAFVDGAAFVAAVATDWQRSGVIERAQETVVGTGFHPHPASDQRFWPPGWRRS